ncbi:MAG: glycosyltransferase [Cyanobacteria bacterium]|nr:glycosyltransferase [Cyanobacteriota bacterium]
MARILLAVHKFFPDHRAGTEVLTLKIAHELQRRDHEVLVVTANPPDADARLRPGDEFKKYEYEGIQVHSIEEPLRLKSYKYSHEYFNPLIGEHFGTILDQFKPDVVHIMHAQNLSGSIIEQSKQRGLRVILSPTDFWYICPIVQLKRPDGTICRGPGPGAKNCLTCYTGELIPPRDQFKKALSQRLAPVGDLPLAGDLLYPLYTLYKFGPAAASTCNRPAVLRQVVNQADAITVPTKLMKGLLSENGIDERLLHHVPFGIDTSELESFDWKTPSDQLRIGFIGTIYEHKGVDILIKAFQRLKEPERACLKIYGDMNQFPQYSKKLRESVDSDAKTKPLISFLGTFPNQVLGERLTEIDTLVVPSRWYENTPLVMQSALTTRTPLIATDLGGMSELIEDGENGFVFALNDYAELAGKLDKLIDNRNLLDQFRGKIGKQKTIKEMVDELVSLYFAANQQLCAR